MGEGSKTRAGPADIKHVSVDLKSPFTRHSAGDLSGPSESFYSRQSVGSPGASRFPPSFEIVAVDEVPFYAAGREAHAARSSNNRRLSSDADDNKRSVAEAETIPFAWEGSPRTRKALKGTSVHKAKHAQVASAVVISMLKNEQGFSPTPKKNHRKHQIWPSSVAKVKDVQHSLASPRLGSLGDGEMSRMHLFNGASVQRLKDHLHRTEAEDVCVNSLNSDYRYEEEESPVSTLQHPASPPATNSCGTSGPLPGSAATTLPVRRMPSIFASSAHSSPAISTSSSTRYMGHCLQALQKALAADPENSKPFEDSFVQLDNFVDGDYAKSPLDEHVLGLDRRRQDSRAWAGDVAYSELEPKYDAMDFYTDSEEEHYHDRISSGASSLAHSSSGSSISRRIRWSVIYRRPSSVEDYSQKDKRLLLDHPSSWVEDRGEDSIGSSLTSSKCNTLNRHQEVFWDEQQADLDSVRVEEVVRGAIDGLRFTYSPVSSAFKFTRSNEGDEEVTSGRKRQSHHKTRTDSEASMRFSTSLDYEASLCSEDTRVGSFAHGSDVIELSRAESWSKVARGIALQHGYQDAVPSSFIKRAGHTPPMFEDSNGSTSGNLSPAFNPHGLADGTDLVRKRQVKKSGMTTCLPFKAILKNFRTMGSPGRSRLGLTRSDDDGLIPAVNRLTY